MIGQLKSFFAKKGITLITDMYDGSVRCVFRENIYEFRPKNDVELFDQLLELANRDEPRHQVVDALRQ